MEPAERVVVVRKISTRIQHAKHVHIAVIIRIVAATVKIRILLPHRIYRHLDKLGLLIHIVGQVYIGLHKVEVETRFENVKRLCAKIVPHRTEAARRRVVLRIQQTIDRKRIAVRLVAKLHKKNGETVLALLVPVRGTHLEQGTRARIRSTLRPSRHPRGAFRLYGILGHYPCRVQLAVGLHLARPVHARPELPRPSPATGNIIAGLHLRRQAILVGIVVYIAIALHKQFARFRSHIEEPLVAHENNRKRISPVVDFPRSRIKRRSDGPTRHEQNRKQDKKCNETFHHPSTPIPKIYFSSPNASKKCHFSRLLLNFRPL